MYEALPNLMLKMAEGKSHFVSASLLFLVGREFGWKTKIYRLKGLESLDIKHRKIKNKNNEN